MGSPAYPDGMGDILMLVASDSRALDPDFVKAGWWGLLVVLGIAVGIVILARSLGKHMRRAGEPWEGENPDDTTREDHAGR